MIEKCNQLSPMSSSLNHCYYFSVAREMVRMDVDGWSGGAVLPARFTIAAPGHLKPASLHHLRSELSPHIQDVMCIEVSQPIFLEVIYTFMLLE